MQRIVIALIVLLMSFGSASAQFLPDLFKSVGQQLVERAVKDGVMYLRQDYQLRDTLTNTRYGWNHQAMFNSIYSVGFKVEGGYVVNGSFVKPWGADSRYSELQDTTLLPVISKTLCRPMCDSVAIELAFNPDHIRPIKDSLLYRIDSLPHARRGLRTDATLGEKDGWMVWVVTTDTLLHDQTELSFVSYRQKITTVEETREYQLPAPTTTKTLLAGVFLVPIYTQIGMIDFQVVGYAYPQGSDWFIAREAIVTPSIAAPVVASDDIEEEAEASSLLTPIDSEEQAEEENATQRPPKNRTKKRQRNS